MRPSQVPNLLSHPPSRRVLPLQTPEQCNKGGFSSQCHLSHLARSVNLSEFVTNSPTNIDLPMNHLPKGSLGPKRIAQPPASVPNTPANIFSSAYVPSRLGHFCSSQLVPPSPGINNISSDRPYSLSTKFVKNFSSHPTPSHSRSDQEPDFKVTPSISGNYDDKAQKQEHFTVFSFFFFYIQYITFSLLTIVKMSFLSFVNWPLAAKLC